VIRYATAEILDVKASRGPTTLVLNGARGAGAELELVTTARSARLDGRRVAAKPLGRRLRLSFTLSGEPQTLVVR
jgi:hypothetical protein